MQVMAHSKEAFRKAIRSGVPLLIGSATEERLAYRRDSHHSRRLALDGFLKNDTIPTRLSAFVQFIGDESDEFTVGGAVVFAEKFTAEQPVQHRLSPLEKVFLQNFQYAVVGAGKRDVQFKNKNPVICNSE